METDTAARFQIEAQCSFEEKDFPFAERSAWISSWSTWETRKFLWVMKSCSLASRETKRLPSKKWLSSATPSRMRFSAFSTRGSLGFIHRFINFPPITCDSLMGHSLQAITWPSPDSKEMSPVSSVLPLKSIVCFTLSLDLSTWIEVTLQASKEE